MVLPHQRETRRGTLRARPATDLFVVAVLRLPPRSDAGLPAEVVAAAQRGERSAQGEVVEHFARPVWALVCRILNRAGHRQLAADTTQDALLTVLRSLPRARAENPRALTGFVMTIAARTAVDALRRHRPHASADVDVDVAATEPEPDRRLHARQALERTVERLAPEIRAAFVLRAFHQLEYSEIAEALGIEVGTVKSRLWRARAALKAVLTESEVKP